MILYHEISKESLESVLHDGIKRTSRGQKGQDPAIIKTDQFLDEHRPATLKEAGVCRNNNIYCFMGDGTSLRDIRDGRRVLLNEYTPNDGSVLLRVTVASSICYVSDLDLYDATKDALLHNMLDKAKQLARQYWANVMPLNSFRESVIARPEVLVTTDITSSRVSVVKA